LPEARRTRYRTYERLGWIDVFSFVLLQIID